MEDERKRSSVEPVGCISGFHNGHCVIQPTDPTLVLPVGMALYRAPREWVGLTDGEIDILSCETVKGNKSVNWLCKVLEAKLREKNHG